MSNLQDVPLAEPEPEPENLPPTAEQTVTGNKTNSLKRFFKLGKKSNSSQDINTEHAACEVLEDTEANKESGKPGSISRFLTRLKGTSKTGDMPAGELAEPALGTPAVVVESVERAVPVPNAKPTLKTSISSYWKLLFHRQKAANRQGGVDSELDPVAIATALEQTQKQQQMDMNEQQQQEQQQQQSEPLKAEDAFTVTPATSRNDIKATTLPNKLDELAAGHCIPQIMEEVQVLSISEEIVEPSALEETIHN